MNNSKVVNCRIDRFNDIIDFKPVEHENNILKKWNDSINQILDMVDITANLINREREIYGKWFYVHQGLWNNVFLLRIILYLPYSSYLQYFIVILKEEWEASGKHEISLFFYDLVNLCLSPTTWCPPPQHSIFFYYLGFLVVNNFFNLNY